MEFNFKNVKKELFRVTLPDDRVLTIKPPKYSDFKLFGQIGERLKSDGDAFKAVCDILNMNVEKIEISLAGCYEIFDVADAAELLNSFMGYLTGLANQKN